jgi:GT2 family glycosyltransferase
MKTIFFILSYNNPSMTDRMVENLNLVVKGDFIMVVLDNGSDSDKTSRYTTHSIDKNVRMTGGFNEGIKIIEKEHSDYDNIWFFTNDCFFIDNGICPLESSEKFLQKYPEIGILHPSESPEVKVIYDVHYDPIVKGVKLVTEYDIVCPIFTKKAIKAIGGKFNPKLYQGWGLDHESSFLVRQKGLLVGINHEIIIGHDTSSTYDKGLDELHPNRESYYSAALTEMYNVFNEIYGNHWHQKFNNLYNENKGKILS